MQKHIKIHFSIAAVLFLSVVGILLNHSSYDISWYSSQSVHQQEAIAQERLRVFGPFTYNINFDGSVVYPLSFANDVRTGVIDGILMMLSGGLVWKILEKKNG